MDTDYLSLKNKEEIMKMSLRIALVLVIGLSLVTNVGWAAEEKMPKSGFLTD